MSKSSHPIVYILSPLLFAKYAVEVHRNNTNNNSLPSDQRIDDSHDLTSILDPDNTVNNVHNIKVQLRLLFNKVRRNGVGTPNEMPASRNHPLYATLSLYRILLAIPGVRNLVESTKAIIGPIKGRCSVKPEPPRSEIPSTTHEQAPPGSEIHYRLKRSSRCPLEWATKQQTHKLCNRKGRFGPE